MYVQLLRVLGVDLKVFVQSRLRVHDVQVDGLLEHNVGLLQTSRVLTQAPVILSINHAPIRPQVVNSIVRDVQYRQRIVDKPDSVWPRNEEERPTDVLSAIPAATGELLTIP